VFLIIIKRFQRGRKGKADRKCLGGNDW